MDQSKHSTSTQKLFVITFKNNFKWIIYRICIQLAGIAGFICLVFSHEHYTIDILAAYYVVTHTFWMFHAAANDQKLKVFYIFIYGLTRVLRN